jgi:lysophospholipase L1-like esterase
MTYRGASHMKENTMTAKLRTATTLAVAMMVHGAAFPGAMPRADEHWVTSWYAAPQPGWDSRFLLPMNLPASLDKQSLRETVRLSAGGHRIRLVLSNRYGNEAVQVGEIRVRPPDGSVRTVSFSGKRNASILPGAVITSDAIVVDLPPLARLVVTTYLPARTPVASFHWGGQQTMQLAAGNAAAAPRFPDGARIEGRLLLNAVLVDAAPAGRTVVAFGDSITDGNGSTPDADRRWPDVLAERLSRQGIAVANAGISGARLLKDGMGRSALARFEQDVLAQPGVSDVIVLLGTNDIGWPGSPFAPGEPAVSFDELIAGYRQLANAAHARGVRVTIGTLPPFDGALEGTPYAGHYSLEKDKMRNRVNRWIRTAGLFDAVVDFDAILRDPDRPQRLRPGFDSGDHLHPGDAGYRAMAAAIVIPSMKTEGRQ